MEAQKHLQVRLGFPGRGIQTVSRVCKAILLVSFSIFGFMVGLPVPPLATSQPAVSSASSPSPTVVTQSPRTVGADRATPVQMPRTLVSGVDDLIGAGGVIKASPDNITIYNLAVRMRLLGGSVPKDELLGQDLEVLSSNSSWTVQAQVGTSSVPLQPRSNNFTLLGTNRTGTFVKRTMTVGFGIYTGTLTIIYKALSNGSLKWDLAFNPNTTGHYEFSYSWSNITNTYDLSPLSRRIDVASPTVSYRLSWNDIPSPLAATTSIQAGSFGLLIDLGTVSGGTRVTVDPSLVSNSTDSRATAYTFQRKVFYEPKGGYYFVFYWDGLQTWYKSSHDGLTWSSPQQPPITQSGRNPPGLFTSGQSIVMSLGLPSGSSLYLDYVVGNIIGPSISWGSVQQLYRFDCVGCVAFNIDNIGVTISATGRVVLSFNYYNITMTGGPHLCISTLYALYLAPGTRLVSVDFTKGCVYGAGAVPDELRSTLTPADSQGKVRLVYQKSVPNGSGWSKTLRSTWLDATSNGAIEVLDGNVPDTPEFSVLSTLDYRTQVVWKTLPTNTVSYAYRGTSDSSWTLFTNIFQGTAYYPTLTADYSTNDVYAFAVDPQNSSILMKKKTSIGNWSDSSATSPVVHQISPVHLGSNFASASAANSSTLALVWTAGPVNSLYNVTFASIPIQTVWSPYASPSDPWNGDGIVPYGQYFTNLGESVSPSSGMLTISQTDLSLKGRGLDLSFTRVYTEPIGFLNGRTYSYESYPWAPMGNGWQLNFPWMENVSEPQFIHLWNGESYRIPAGFWSGKMWSFENHQGEDFILSHLTPSNLSYVQLTTRSGIVYSFDGSHRLTHYGFTTSGPPDKGSWIFFEYDIYNRVYKITDTVGRVFIFNYYTSTSLVQYIIEGAPAVNWVALRYNGQMLTSATDAANRTTNYAYKATSDSVAVPWLVSRITYPTGWYTNYTFTRSQLGTEVYTFRVGRQWVGFGTGFAMPVRQFSYSYSPGAGDQILGSSVATYNGTQLVSYTKYLFSSGSVEWNLTDASNKLVRGFMQQFGAHGAVVKETVVVADGAGGTDPPGAYTAFCSYDLWGNRIYARQSIDPLTSAFHESFNSYYNDGLPPAFSAFQETFSQDQGNSTDNVWSVRSGAWLVQNGQYNGTETAGEQAEMVSSADIGVSNVSISARIFIGRQINTTAGSTPRVGIFAHYDQTVAKSYKWALVLVNTNSGWQLNLLDEWNQWFPGPQNLPITQGWYTFQMNVTGYNVWGSATTPAGFTYNVAAIFNRSSPARGTGFGLYAGGFSALFDNVTVTTAHPDLGNSFSNSFYPSGAPWSSVHGALAGSAEHQNGNSVPPVETYYNDTLWGSVNQMRQRYDSAGTNWLVTSRSYDSYGNLVKLTDPRGNSTLYGYSSPKNSNYQFAYVTSKNSTLIPGNTLISSRYNYNFSTGLMTSSLDPMGHNTTYSYDILGRLKRIAYPTGDYTAYLYSDTANYVDITNENGWHARQVYDGLGRLSTVETFLNGKSYSNETSTYNWQNQESSKRDAMGNVTYYQYDPLGRLSNTTYPDRTSVLQRFNDTGSWMLIKNQNGNYACKVYDRLGRPISVVEISDPNCHPVIVATYAYVTNYYYDEVGNLLQTINAKNQSTLYKYDNLNRPIKTSYPDVTSEYYSYDSNGNLVSKTSRGNLTTTYLYDSLNRVVTVTMLATPTAMRSYSYDNNGNLLGVVGTNATIAYGYDARNRMINETYYVGGNFTLTVSPNSVYFFCSIYQCSPTSATATLTVTSINGFGGTISLSYLPPITGIGGTLLAGPPSVNVPPSGTVRATVTAYMGTKSGTYNWTIQGQSLGFTASTVYTIKEYICSRPPCPTAPAQSSPMSPSPSSYTVRFSYTGELMSNITYPDASIVHYAYDSLGRLSAVSTPPATTYATLSYYPNDRVSSMTFGNGLVANYTYDRLSRTSTIMLGQSGKTLLSLSYQYNKTGTVASLTGKVNALTVNEQYSYDALQRLNYSSVTSNGASNPLSYQYDNLGNRQQQNVNGQVTSYYYNPANNELTSSNGPCSTINYYYDGDGKLVGRTGCFTAGIAFSWDAAGDLVKATSNGTVLGTYVYDGMGRRVESVETSTVYYAYLGTETLYEYNATGKTNTDYIYAGPMRIGTVSRGTVNYYHTDALGSTRLITDSSQKIVFSDGYQPYGQDNGTPIGSSGYRFTGKPVSQTTGLYYEYARWYDPSIGRFISQDPLGGVLSNPQSLNPYVYVENVPTVLLDPSGAAFECGGKPCEGGGDNSPRLWTSSDAEASLKANSIRDPDLIAKCLDNPMNCPTLLRVRGYNPDALPGAEGGTPGLTEGLGSPGTGSDLGSTTPPTIDANPAVGPEPSETPKLNWPANSEGMNDLLGEPGTPIPDTVKTPGRGKMVWQIRSDPRMSILGEQHPYDVNARPFKQAWHWHVEPGHNYWGIPGTPMPDWLVNILTALGYL